MRRPQRRLAFVVWLAIAGTCLPPIAAAAPPRSPLPPVADVTLRDGGVLLGQVIRPEGAPLPNLPVSLVRSGKELAPSTTNTTGYFAFSGLTMGTYEVVTPAGIGVCRVWTAETAPPGALPGIVIVNTQATVRGQYDARTFAGMVGKPLVLGGLVAAAIAVPVAVSNANRTPASSH